MPRRGRIPALLVATLALACRALGQPGPMDPAQGVRVLDRALREADASLLTADLPASRRSLPGVGDRPPLPGETPAPEGASLGAALDVARLAEDWYAYAEALAPAVTLVGIPTPDERQATRVAGAAVIRFAAAAAVAIDAALDAIDTDPRAGDDADRDAIDRATLMRETVLPLLSARAAAWITATMAGEGRETVSRYARAAAQAARPVSPWAGFHRASTLAILAALGGDAVASHRWIEEAREVAREDERLRTRARADRAMLEALDALLLLHASTPADARRALAALDGSDAFAARGRRDFGLALLLAGARARVELISASVAATPEAKAAASGRAIDAHARLIRADDTTEPSPDERRRRVYHRLGPILDAVDPSLPGPAVATAARLASADASDPAARAEAIAMGRREIERLGQGPDDPMLSDLLYEQARLLAHDPDPGSRLAASAHFARLVELDPASDRAGQAVALSCATARAALDAGPTDVDGARRAYRARLELAHTTDAPVPDRDAYRLEYLALLAEEARSLGPGLDGVWRRSGELAGAIEDPSLRPRAAELLARSRWATLALSMRAGDERVPRYAEGLADAAGALEAAAGLGAPADAPARRAEAAIYRAEAMLAMDRPGDALQSVEAIALDGLSRERRDAFAPAALKLRARALARLGRADDTLDTLVGLRALDPESARDAARWIVAHAWRAIEPRQDRFLPLEDPPREVVVAADALDAAQRFDADGDASSPVTARAAGIAALAVDRPRRALERLAPLRRAGSPDPAVDLPLAQAHLAARQDAEAFAILRALSTSLEPDGEATRAYLQAWTLMLETLLRNDADGERRATVRRELRRLRENPALAEHPDCAARLDAIALALARGR
jgi:hypothetical protein